MWNFLIPFQLLPSLNFVDYAGIAITAYAVSLLVTMLIKGGNVD